jgi:hypothetical protein
LVLVIMFTNRFFSLALLTLIAFSSAACAASPAEPGGDKADQAETQSGTCEAACDHYL